MSASIEISVRPVLVEGLSSWALLKVKQSFDKLRTNG
jgi:hypothetical protein